MARLKPKQQRFVEEYLVDLNATQAAIRAGYSPRTARLTGHRLITNDNVAAEIESRQKALQEETEITQRRVLGELALIGFANMLDYVQVQTDGTAHVDLSRLTREQAAAIQEMTVDEYTDRRGQGERAVRRVRVKLLDKGKNLERIGRHLGMFQDKLKLDPPEGSFGVVLLPERVRNTETRDEA